MNKVRLIVELDISKAAFDKGLNGPYEEAGRLFKKASQYAEDTILDAWANEDHLNEHGQLMDFNGNVVGNWQIEEIN